MIIAIAKSMTDIVVIVVVASTIVIIIVVLFLYLPVIVVMGSIVTVIVANDMVAITIWIVVIDFVIILVNLNIFHRHYLENIDLVWLLLHVVLFLHLIFVMTLLEDSMKFHIAIIFRRLLYLVG